MINTLQMILHLPIFSIVIPGNVAQMFEILIPIAMFDALADMNKPILVEIFGEQDPNTFKASRSLDQMTDLGYESYNPLINLGTIGVLLFFYLLQVMLLPFVYLFYKKTGYLKSFYIALRNNVVFFGLFVLILEGYMELLISAGLLYDAP